MKHTLDATSKRLGRVATEVAVLLMGKNRTDFAKNKIPDIKVEVINASKFWIDARKKRDKTYVTHSGYPGHLKTRSMQQVIDSKGEKEVLRMAVLGMLPKNKLRPQMMKNLTITD
jgi:large subunit ribosomal protein L13